ncbi:hypothetical protein ABZS79_08380 [Streptomyces griseoloalbus]|uniref:hypothetical protein n=1 Tax=Streptomyces griseoloalbus TaxID=67303 RepID=UPI0033BCC8FD
MTWSAALSGAALRAMRTVAGRRAVQVALLVGGVFVLGVLCGERAQAADGAPVAKTPSVSVARSAPSAGGTPSTDPSAPPESDDPEPTGDVPAPPRPAAADPIRPSTATATASASASAIRSVGERAVRPVGELVGAVAGGLGETPGNLPDLPALPGLAHPAPLPLPELPGLPTVPGNALPEPNTPGPGPGTPTSPQTTAPAPDGPKGPEGPAGTAGHVAHGQESTGTAGAPHGGHGHGTAARDAVHAEPAPAPHAPPGQSDGTPGQRPAADNGTPRHGDACAVTAPHRPPLRLVPGAVARAEATGTRDRYRDVPVSPA